MTRRNWPQPRSTLSKESAKLWRVVRSTGIFCKVLDHPHEFNRTIFHSDEFILALEGCKRAVEDMTRDLLVETSMKCTRGVVGLVLGCFLELGFSLSPLLVLLALGFVSGLIGAVVLACDRASWATCSPRGPFSSSKFDSHQ